MSEKGLRRERIEGAPGFVYPEHDFSDVARHLGIFDNPDIKEYHEYCVESEFQDETAYRQGLLPIVHSFDLDHQDGIPDRKLHGLGLLIADIHFRTERYSECLCELLAIKRRLMSEGGLDEELIYYVTAAVHDIAPSAKRFEKPVVGSDILANKNLPG